MDDTGLANDTGGWSSGPVLGVGASGEVRQGTRAGVVGAVKRASDPAGIARLDRERAALARLSHPGVVGVLDAGPGWLVLALVPGRTLLHHRGPPAMPVPVALGVVGALAAAVAHAHARGVAHRDLKPSNVMVRPDGAPVILDFGGAALLGEASAPVGTPGYAPPEWGAPGADPRAADVYALGVITWELICGRDAPRTAPLELPGGDTAPNAAAWVVRAATSVDPAQRPTAAALAEHLAGWAVIAPSGGETLSVTDGDTLAPAPPATRVGRYALRGVLGRGGAGTVYRAWDPTLGREVALKRLHAVDDGPARARFEREARTLAALRHPDVVGVLDFGVDADGGAPYYTMELIEAPDLRQLLARGPVDRDRAVRWVLSLAAAVGAAHAAGVVHRDVKPANVLIDGDRPRLVDFGLATDASADTLTRTGQVMGTPAYMSPEQAAGRPVDARTDIYGLGVVLYELLCGVTPFAADHPAAVLHGVLHGEPRAIVDVAPGTPPLLARVCHRAIARSPDARYPSMEAFIADLERAVAGEAVQAAGTWRVRARRLWAERRGLWTAVAAVGLAAVAASAPIGWRAMELRAREAAAFDRLAVLNAEVEAMLSAGRPAEADALAEAFFASPEVSGTRAWVDARLAHADRLRDRGAPDAAIRSCAQAFSGAEGDEDTERALLCMGELFLAAQAWDPLGGVVMSLDARHLGRAANGLRQAAAAAQGDLAGAAALGGALGPALRGLSGVTGAGAVFTAAEAIDLDGDGRAELLGVNGTGPISLLAGGAWDQPAQPLAGEAGVYNRLRAVDGGALGPLLVAWGHPEPGSPPSTVVFRLTPAPQRVAVVPSGPIGGVAVADLDGDGAATLYVGLMSPQRELLAFTPDPAGGAWPVAHPHPPTDAAASELPGLVPVRDAQGPALAAADSAFSAYDVRVLRAGPDDAHLSRTARRPVGAVDAMVALPRPGGPDRLLLSRRGPWRAPPGGLPGGLVALDPALELSAAARGGSADCPAIYTGELDGDGVIDAVAACHGETVVVRQAADGALDSVVVAGFAAVAAADADGDGDLEVYGAADGRPWVLGLGDGRLPIRPGLPAAATPPPSASRRTASAWSRAEDLLRMGQVELARAGFDAAAAIDDGPAGGEALLRAAALSVALQDTPGALERCARAADRPEVAQRAVGLAADLAGEHLRFDEAVAWADRERSLGTDDPARAAVREGWARLAGAPEVALDLSAGVDPRIRVVRPLEARAAPDGKGVALSLTSGRPVLRLPLRRVAEHIGVAGELSLVHGEYDSHLVIALQPVGAPDARAWLWIKGVGSSERIRASAGCLVGGVGLAEVEWDEGGAAWTGGLQFALSLTADARACALASTTRREARAPLGASAALGDWELVVMGREDDAVDQIEVVLHKLSITGFEVDDTPQSRVDALRAAVSAGRYSAALALAPGGSPEEDLLAAVALDGAGLTAEGVARLQAAVAAGPPDVGALAPIVRGRAPHLGAALQLALGDRWSDLFYEVWRTPITMHLREPYVGAALLGLPDPVVSADPGVVSELERARSVALRLAHAPEAAARAADHAIAAARALGPDGGRALALALRAKALACAADQPDAAFAALTEALAAHPAPETLADALTADPGLAPLRGDRRWAGVVALSR